MSEAGRGRLVAGKTEKVCLSFTIPSLPPSSNSLYNVLFRLRRVELKPEARLWKSRAKEFTPPFKVGASDWVDVSIILSGNWLSKEGKIRKVDVTNREKLILDAICEKQGWDDSQVWCRRICKSQDVKKEFVSITLMLSDGILS